MLLRRRRFAASVVGGAALACILYCLIAPGQFEARGRISLRTSPATTLNLDESHAPSSDVLASGQTQLETLANVFRSDQLAWSVIATEKLYQSSAFMGSFPRRFPGFRIEKPSPEAQAFLLDRFQRRLSVLTIPRTLILEIRFRTSNAALSAAVVNALIRAYGQQEMDSRARAAVEATSSLKAQLDALKARTEQDDQRLIDFQKRHGLIDTPETLANGQPGDVGHDAIFSEIDDLGRQLASATADRILREAEYRAATHGDPELVVASDPSLQGDSGTFATGVLRQLRGRHSDLELEQAQLSLEHGPNFPRVVEVRRQLQDIDQQTEAENARLVERFREAWKTSTEREQLVRDNLDGSTRVAMKLNEAATEYAVMRQQADSSHELYSRVLEKTEEAGLAADVYSSNISVVDYARQPVKPAAPDLPLYLAITLFVSLWLAVGGAHLLETLNPSGVRSAAALLVILFATMAAHGQAPTPSTSGLPAGVAHIPQSVETKSHPDAHNAPAIWGNPSAASQAGPGHNVASPTAALMAAPIGPGDLMEVSEYHTPEFHAMVRVSDAGTVILPLVGEIRISGMDDLSAAHAIEAALVAQGMLLHPQVSVLITAYVGQDVSVLGEVERPGVYPYTFHHRLLDLISAASGLGPNAGSLVTITHRDSPQQSQAVVLDPTGTDTVTDHNPELQAGDTVEVNRAGLVYVIGDVMRPGGFPVIPNERLTVVQALTLAWGPSQNASLTKALLIREQNGGRTLTTLNLKRLLRGQDPDLPIQDHDIIFVPDSTAKNLWNRTMESVIQSAAGVSIYAGMVYSQRF